MSSVSKRPRAKNEDDDLTARPKRRDDAGSDGYDHDDDALPQSAMPNAFRACLSAGSALIFDSS